MRVLNTRTVTTRKPHDCWGCARELPAGTWMEVVTDIDDGRFRHTYWCETCVAYVDEYCDYEYGEPIHYGSLSDNQDWWDLRREMEGDENPTEEVA